MAISTFDGYTDAAFNRPQSFFVFNSAAYATASTSMFSLWQMPGTPGNGVTPPTGSGGVCTLATGGSVPFTPASGGRSLYLGPCGMASSTGMTMYIADRYVHTSGLSGTTTTAQPVNTVALPSRAGTGVGVYAAIEVYTALGGSTVTATLTYTNSAGVAGRTSTTSLVGGNQGRFCIFPLTGGDLGVQSVQSVQHATTGGVGDYGITLFKPIAIIPGGVTAGVMPQASVFDTGTSILDSEACLFVYVFSAGSSNITTYTIGLVEG